MRKAFRPLFPGFPRSTGDNSKVEHANDVRLVFNNKRSLPPSRTPLRKSNAVSSILKENSKLCHRYRKIFLPKDDDAENEKNSTTPSRARARSTKHRISKRRITASSDSDVSMRSAEGEEESDSDYNDAPARNTSVRKKVFRKNKKGKNARKKAVHKSLTCGSPTGRGDDRERAASSHEAVGLPNFESQLAWKEAVQVTRSCALRHASASKREGSPSRLHRRS